MSVFHDISKATDIHEAMKIAKLDFTVEARNLYIDCGDHNRECETHKAIVRTDNERLMGVVGKKWKPYQVEEGFLAMQQLVEEGVMAFDSAISFAGGKSVAVTGTLGESGFRNDPQKNNIIFATGFGGNRATTFNPSRTRPVCMNTLMMALKEGEKGVRLMVKHTRYSKERINELINDIGLLAALYREDDRFNEELARRQASPSIVNAFLQLMIPNPPEDQNPKRAISKRELMEELLRTGKGSDIHLETGFKVRDTLYGLRQSVTEYVTHHRQTRLSAQEKKTRNVEEKRVESALWGSGNKFRERADEILLEILDKGIVEESAPVDAVALMEELEA